jgi:LysR family glycine cleavage system transcriptional activator
MKARANPPLIAARSFEAAARHGSFQRAAQELHVTPTAISHQIKRLEDYLGTQLFVRGNRQVTLTADGRALCPRLGELFAALEHALDPAAFTRAKPLRITAMPSLAAKWLAHRVADYALQAAFPIELSDDDRVVDFADGAFDIALRYGDGNYPGVAVHPWMSAKVVAVCSPALQASVRPAVATDVLKHTLIHDSTIHLPGKPPGWEAWLRREGATLPPAHPGLRYASVSLALEAARAGKGFALAPEPLVRDDLRQGHLAAPFPHSLDNPYAFWIVHPRHLEEDARVQAFTRWLRECD